MSEARAVLDASAVLALIQDEPGAGPVKNVLPGALLSAVNFAEVLTKLSERGLPVAIAEDLVLSLGIEVVPFVPADAVPVAELRAGTRRAGLPLADRACLCLARARGLPALTTDGAWEGVAADAGVAVVNIRTAA